MEQNKQEVKSLPKCTRSRHSAPDAPHLTYYIRRITIKISQDIIQDGKGHAPHPRIMIRRIFWRCTNIPEYINLGPHAKLSQCAASTYQMRRILPSDRNYKYPKTRRILCDILYPKTRETQDEFSRIGSTRHTLNEDTRAVRRSCMYSIH